jgi:hypothetical protein
MTHSLAKHVDRKTEKTADLFTMIRKMMEGQNNRIKALETTVTRLERLI